MNGKLHASAVEDKLVITTKRNSFKLSLIKGCSGCIMCGVWWIWSGRERHASENINMLMDQTQTISVRPTLGIIDKHIVLFEMNRFSSFFCKLCITLNLNFFLNYKSRLNEWRIRVCHAFNRLPQSINQSIMPTFSLSTCIFAEQYLHGSLTRFYTSNYVHGYIVWLIWVCCTVQLTWILNLNCLVCIG